MSEISNSRLIKLHKTLEKRTLNASAYEIDITVKYVFSNILYELNSIISYHLVCIALEFISRAHLDQIAVFLSRFKIVITVKMNK